MAHTPKETEKPRRTQRGSKAKNSDDLAERLVTLLDPASAASEAYRTLRTNLLYALVDNPPKGIVLTSPGPGEGKSTTCANLGVVLAQAGKNVLMLDCDFRKPVLHKVFGVRNFRGLVNHLIGENNFQEVATQPIEGLTLMSVGPIPPNPAELLSTQRFADFFARTRAEYDYVLVDAPPVGLVSDAMVLAAMADGVLLVVDGRNTRKGAVRQAMRSLQTVGANVFGTVMNNVKTSKDGYYYDYTYE